MEANHVEFTGSVPDNYDRCLGPDIFFDYGADLASRVASSSPRRILEVASGTGIVTRQLRDAIADTSDLVATDLNTPMLEVAKTKFTSGERVDFRKADALDLPFDDGSFDAVACQFGVMFFPDKVAAYREAFRVLIPGGKLVFNVWSSFDDNPFARVAHETVSGFFDEDPPGFYRVPFSYHDTDEIRSDVEAAGFHEVAVTTDPRERVLEDIDRFAHGVVYGNPVAEEIRARGSVSPEEVKAAVAEAFRNRFGNEPTTMPLRAIVFEAARP